MSEYEYEVTLSAAFSIDTAGDKCPPRPRPPAGGGWRLACGPHFWLVGMVAWYWEREVTTEPAEEENALIRRKLEATRRQAACDKCEAEHEKNSKLARYATTLKAAPPDPASYSREERAKAKRAVRKLQG